MTAAVVLGIVALGSAPAYYLARGIHRKSRLSYLRKMRHLYDEEWRSGDTVIEKNEASGDRPAWEGYEYVGRRGEEVIFIAAQDRNLFSLSLEEAKRLLNLRTYRRKHLPDQTGDAMENAFRFWKDQRFPVKQFPKNKSVLPFDPVKEEFVVRKRM